MVKTIIKSKHKLTALALACAIMFVGIVSVFSNKSANKNIMSQSPMVISTPTIIEAEAATKISLYSIIKMATQPKAFSLFKQTSDKTTVANLMVYPDKRCGVVGRITLCPKEAVSFTLQNSKIPLVTKYDIIGIGFESQYNRDGKIKIYTDSKSSSTSYSYDKNNKITARFTKSYVSVKTTYQETVTGKDVMYIMLSKKGTTNVVLQYKFIVDIQKD